MTNWQPIEYDDIREGEVYRTTYLSERAAKGEFGEVGSRAVYEVDMDARPSPESEIPVGTTGTATVRGVEGVRLIRSSKEGERCEKSKRRDGLLHSWRFDGDDPYIICVYCDEMRGALTGRVIREGRTDE